MSSGVISYPGAAVCALLLALCAVCASAGIIDLFTWDLGSSLSTETSDSNRREDSPTPATQRNCSCEGPACSCCLDFTLSFIDLGGPGCVRMKYISPSEGILVNVSYGESDLHSETVKGANPEPTCMNLLTDLAQVCARFSDLAPTNDGLRWCLQLEPTLLGDVQTQYQVGCFRMGPQGMTVDPPVPSNATFASPDTANENSEKPGESSEEETTDSSEAALIAAVNESAEEGIAFFSNLLGINFGGAELPPNNTETVASNTTVTSEGSPAANTTTPGFTPTPTDTSTTPVPVTTTTTAAPSTSTATSTPAPPPSTSAEQRLARSRFRVPGTSINRLE